MKKILLILTVGLLVLTSCKKEVNGNTSTVVVPSTTIDGELPPMLDTIITPPPIVDSTLHYKFIMNGASSTSNITKIISVNGSLELTTNTNTFTINCNAGDVITYTFSYMYPDQYASNQYITVRYEKTGGDNEFDIWNWIDYMSPTGFGSDVQNATVTAIY